MASEIILPGLLGLFNPAESVAKNEDQGVFVSIQAPE